MSISEHANQTIEHLREEITQLTAEVKRLRVALIKIGNVDDVDIALDPHWAKEMTSPEKTKEIVIDQRLSQKMGAKIYRVERRERGINHDR